MLLLNDKKISNNLTLNNTVTLNYLALDALTYFPYLVFKFISILIGTIGKSFLSRYGSSLTKNNLLDNKPFQYIVPKVTHSWL
jgi:hypothetical protein